MLFYLILSRVLYFLVCAWMTWIKKMDFLYHITPVLKSYSLLMDLWYEYPYRLPRFIFNFFYKIDTKHLGTSVNVPYLAKFSLFPSLSGKIKRFSHSSILLHLNNINLIKTTEQILRLGLKPTEQFSCIHLKILLSWYLHN